MIVEVKIPAVGESVREGLLVAWLRKDGEFVQADDPLFELETDKINMTISAERAGRLSIRVPAETKAKIGQVVGSIDTEAAAEAGTMVSMPLAGAAAPAPKRAPSIPAVPQADGPPLNPPAGVAQMRAKLAGARSDLLSPAARRLVDEHGLDADRIEGTGKGGRITKGDVIQFMEGVFTPQAAAHKALAPPPAREAEEARAPAPMEAPATVYAPSIPAVPERVEEKGALQTRKPMSPLRARIAERLVQAQQAAAILTTFNEADMSAVIEMRRQMQDRFQERTGAKLGFMSFFVKAAVDALQLFPIFNSQIDGDDIVTNHFYHIGIAVSTDRGLVVPVIRDADRLSFGELEQKIADFAARAQAKKLELSELTGGCFTITNGGVFGSLLSTPILNPPQSGILGMHAIKKRPVVIDDKIVIRPMMYLAVSYDHRLVDGQDAVLFLKRIVETIEAPERLFFEA